MVFGFHHEVASPRDPASGLPTGKRHHKPITITKEVDKSTPLLMNVLVTNENITQWELRFFKPSGIGKKVQYYTIQLVNASISRIHSEMLSDKELEHISFCYQKITWTFENGGITAEDDWEAPVA